MDKLRGTGSTFSTSGRRWKPFRLNPKVAARNARLHRLKRQGIIGTETKEQLRAQAEQAMRDHAVLQK